MTGCDLLWALFAPLWPVLALYFIGLALTSYLVPLVRPREWGADAVSLCAWFWPLGLWCLVQGRLSQAGRDAQYRLAEEQHALRVVERVRKPSTTWDDHADWNEYTDHARGMVVRWRDA